MHMSIPQTMAAEIINVNPINPLISACEIKVLYWGKNRNRSYISKEVATKMANSLPNIPIVGEYLEQVNDFGDHAQETVIDSQGIRTIKRTVPYGVVPADTKIVWKTFLDDDGVEREYLVCQGYLWTGRYPECARVVEKGNGQSMELDVDSIKGEWSTIDNDETEYFIVSDAVFSALCILGEDVEPCFEGSSVTAPNILYSLNKDEFTTEMAQFMLNLKAALDNEGGNEMSKVIKDAIDNPETKDFTVDGQGVENPVVDNTNNNDDNSSDFAKKEDEDEEKSEDDEDKSTEPSNDDEGDSKEDDDKKEDEEDKKAKYNLDEVTEYTELLASYNQLKADHEALVAEYEAIKPELFSLREKEAAAIRAEKENMVSKFYMLEEADIADVKKNIDNYTLDEIESKLSVIAVRKKVNFNLDDTSASDNKTEEPVVSFSAVTTDSTPAWLKAVEDVKNSRNI